MLMKDFIPYELAKKLKEKGFSCEIPFAMYNEIACFCLLTTAAPMMVCASGFKCREYYDYEDFDEHDYIAPTISQVLKWLREKKGLYVDISLYKKGYCTLIYETNFPDDKDYANSWRVNNTDNTYEEAAIAGIEYVIDNLI